MEFKKQNANHETGPLVAIDERMVADDASGIKAGHSDNIARAGIGMMLAGTG
jgi:hypothetical protein